MTEKISLMGLELDFVTKDKLNEKIQEYILNHCFHFILFLSEAMIEKAAEEKEYKELLEKADYLLPGENILAYIYEQQIQAETYGIVNYRYFLQMIENLQIEDIQETLNIYFVLKKNKNIDNLIENMKKKYSNFIIEKFYYEALDGKEDLLINEINSVAPDILIVLIESPLQENWIIKNSTKLNVRLCVGMGGILKEIEEEEQQIPKIFQFFHAENFYNRWKKKKRKTLRIFQKKIAHYNKKQNHE